MNDFTVLVEIEKTAYLDTVAVPAIPHVWKYLLWTTYEKKLPFMPEIDEYNSEGFSVGQLLVDGIQFYVAGSLLECQNTDRSYYQSGQYLYIRCDNGIPATIILSIRYGQVLGFTNDKVRRFNKVTFLPEVASVPVLSISTDPLEYAKMKFASGSATIKNFLAIFDRKIDVFGNDCTIKIGDASKGSASFATVAKYYIENYTVEQGSASFALKDKRELMSKKIPSNLFSQDDYQYIDDDYVDDIIPDAYGYCIGVPGICLNGTEGNVNKVFRFASKITSLDSVKAYRNEQWETVIPISVDNANGTVTLSVANSHDSGVYTNGILEIKATGIFREEKTPKNIILSLIKENLDIPYISTYFDIEEFEIELEGLADVGLYMGESKTVFEWIEKLQTGSNIGFQFYVKFGLFSARRDNPNRNVLSRVIESADIIDFDNVSIDYNATLFATNAKIGYAHDETDDSYNYAVNDEYYEVAKETYRRDKIYELDTLLSSKTDAETRAALVMEDQHIMRPLYKGVKVFGLEWFKLLNLYDIIYVDLRRKAQRMVPTIQEGIIIAESAEDIITVDEGATDVITLVPWNIPKRTIPDSEREFAGYQRCQIIGLKYDVAKCMIELTLRSRSFSDVYKELVE